MKALIALIALALLATACVQQSTSVQSNTTPGATGNVVRTVVIPEGKSRMVMALESIGMPAGVRAVKLTVDAVEIGNGNTWTTVNGDANTYDLVPPVAGMLLGDRTINAEDYSQVRMRIASVIIADDAGDHDARLALKDLVIAVPVSLAQNTTKTVTFRFFVDQSVFRTQDGQYAFLPVVQVITQEGGVVSVTPQRTVIIERGTIVYNVTVGTNPQGQTGQDVRIPPATVIVVRNGEIRTVNQTTVVNNTVVNNTIINNTTVNNAVVQNTTVMNNTTTLPPNGTANGNRTIAPSNGTNVTAA